MNASLSPRFDADLNIKHDSQFRIGTVEDSEYLFELELRMVEELGDTIKKLGRYQEEQEDYAQVLIETDFSRGVVTVKDANQLIEVPISQARCLCKELEIK